MAPTVHANYRYFERGDGTKPGSWWFGGGADLTPSYLFEEDAIHFHQVHKDACDRHAVADYAHYKKWCDDYFYIKHRNERRGLGGIFFDNLKAEDKETCFVFSQDCAKSFLPSYLPILERRKDLPFTDEQRLGSNFGEAAMSSSIWSMTAEPPSVCARTVVLKVSSCLYPSPPAGNTVTSQRQVAKKLSSLRFYKPPRMGNMTSYNLEELTEDFVQLDEVRLHTVSLGPDDGELVIMLHGFPEYWYSWRHQLPFLASRGYKAVAVDLRGFNLKLQTQGINSYRSETVARDISQLVTALGREDAHIVGHD